MTTTKTRRPHALIVFEAFMAIRNAEKEADSDKLLRVMSRYGRKTLDDAMDMLNDYHAEQLGMTREQFNEWLKKEA